MRCLTACSSEPSCTSSSYRWGWPSPTAGRGHAPLTGQYRCSQTVQGFTVQMPPHVLTQGLVISPCRTPQQNPGVQHAADEVAVSARFYHLSATDRHVIVGVIRPEENIDKRQLVAVGGCQQTCQCQGLPLTASRLAIKALCFHSGLFQLFKQPFPGHKGRQVRRIACGYLVKSAQNRFTEAVQDVLLHFSAFHYCLAEGCDVEDDRGTDRSQP
nr:hypothetical protein [Escherichia coli]